MLGLILGGAALLTPQSGALAQSIVVQVNDDAVTSFEVAQRQRFLMAFGGMDAKTKERVGQRMKERLGAESTQTAFKELMQKEKPTSQAQVEEIKQQFVKQIQQNVLSEASGSLRQQALDELIEERLMMQAARDQKVEMSDVELNEVLTRMAEGGSQKLSLQQFFAQLATQGIREGTLKDRIRARNSWQQVIKRLYAGQLQSFQAAPSSTETPEDDTQLDVQVVRFANPTPGDQKALAQRLVDAAALSKKFKDCKSLGGLIKGAPGVSVKSMNKAKLNDFHGDARIALQRGQPGQMTPPAIDGDAVEVHAICAKSAAGKPKADPGQDKMKEAFQLYSRRHLKDLKARARIEYPKNG